jgi:hypothetical protein
MNYTIIGFNKEAGQIVVRFDPNMSPLAIEIPIEDGKYMAGEALNTYIKGFIPTWHLDRLAAIKAGVSNEAEIEALVVPEPVVEQPASMHFIEQSAQSSLQSDIAFINELINNALAEKGL